jgi:hypothetical protein
MLAGGILFRRQYHPHMEGKALAGRKPATVEVGCGSAGGKDERRASALALRVPADVSEPVSLLAVELAAGALSVAEVVR